MDEKINQPVQIQFIGDAFEQINLNWLYGLDANTKAIVYLSFREFVRLLLELQPHSYDELVHYCENYMNQLDSAVVCMRENEPVSVSGKTIFHS